MRAGTMQSEHGVAYVLRFAALCALVCLMLVSLDNWAAAHFGSRSWLEPFYNARIALLLGLVVGGLHGLTWLVERALFARARWVVGALVTLGTSSVVLDTASQLARGEGLAARGIPYGVALASAIALLYAFVWFVWWLARPVVSGWRALLLGCVALVPLVAFEQLFLRTYGMLAPFVLVGLLLLTTSAVHRLLARAPLALTVVASLGAAALLVLVVVGAVRPGWVASGRRSVLADETAALHVDPLLFAGETAAVRFDLSRAHTFRCAEQERPVAPWPALSLAPEQRRNVVLISIDALRRDRLERERRGQPLTPNLRRFARESRVARAAYTSYPATLFALGSAMTGLWPSEILFAPKPPETIFALAKDELPVQKAIVPKSEWFVLPAFARYVAQEVPRHVRSGARMQTNAALAFLRDARSRGQRHLLWVHYLEPHAPYERKPLFNFGNSAIARYDGEVAALDYELGRLLQLLRTGGWYDDSLIVLFSDHGEALGERSYYGHHVFLQRFISDIPLIVHVPGQRPGAITSPVSIADVAPTVLHYLGIAPPTRLSGETLLGQGPRNDRGVLSEAFPMRGTALFEFAEQPLTSVEALAQRIERIQTGDRRYHPKVALVQNGRRLIVRRTTGTTELYALRDTREAHELTDDEPEVVRTMMRELSRWHHQATERFYCDIVNARATKGGQGSASATLGRD